MNRTFRTALATLLTLVLLCISQQASAQKFGSIDMEQVYAMMPESQTVEEELHQLQAAYDDEIEKMGEEYQQKVSDFVSVQQSLDPNIAEARAQEIEQLQQRIQQFRERAAQTLRDQRQQKTAPIVERVARAIQKVGESYGFTYIFDLKQSGILFCSPSQSEDVLPLVKAELGL